MTRRFEGGPLVIASHNPGKIREIHELLAPFGAEVKSGPEFGFDEPEETGSTFTENALIKSRYFAERTKQPSLSDDSGLVVPALGGAPGIYSARWAGESKDFSGAMQRVREELLRQTGTAEGHAAHFVCALSLCWPDDTHTEVEGKVFGTLVFPPRGNKGFGYDAIFLPKGHGITFGEMEPSAKHAISHRADAFQKLIACCFSGAKQARKG
jgi:XTP/dITP diphosphohydrolase